MSTLQSETLHKTLRLAAAYAAGVVLISSLDVVYVGSSPSSSGAANPTDWCTVGGLRGGTIFVGNWAGPVDPGLATDVHLPQFFPLPFYAGAGPDSGVVAIAVWFVAVVTWIIHSLMSLRGRFRHQRLASTEANPARSSARGS